ncbi:MAG: 4Fe-4S binding protein [Candidatus Coatesbacteria bacterium]|nr:4Fe-4S binding protein [Candidatus Coatesbacteria bacterium]
MNKLIIAFFISILLILLSTPDYASSRKQRPFSEIIAGRCITCELCIQKCPVKAISKNIDGKIMIDYKICIGCSACI